MSSISECVFVCFDEHFEFAPYRMFFGFRFRYIGSLQSKGVNNCCWRLEEMLVAY